MSDTKKRISTGISDYADLISSNCYFVDKTPLIKTVFFEDKNKVLQIIRPRRFGKTLTMSMFRHFLSLDNANSIDYSKYALRKLQANHKPLFSYQKHRTNKYKTISFKD